MCFKFPQPCISHECNNSRRSIDRLCGVLAALNDGLSDSSVGICSIAGGIGGGNAKEADKSILDGRYPNIADLFGDEVEIISHDEGHHPADPVSGETVRKWGELTHGERSAHSKCRSPGKSATNPPPWQPCAHNPTNPYMAAHRS
jgi:hypothetical protein